MTSSELLLLISKPWVSVKDIKRIACCGRDSATHIRDNIRLEIQKSGKKLPSARYIIVPTKYVVDYLNLDVNYITEMAQKEQSIRKD